MSKAVLHFRKVKDSTGLANVAAHNSREKIIDGTGGFKLPPEKMPEWIRNSAAIEFNEGQVGKRSESIGKAWARAVHGANLKRKPQNNAAKGIEAILSAANGTFLKMDEWKKFFDDGLEWIKKELGEENILQWNTHYDETTPHMHIILVPIVRDHEKGNNYSSSKFLGGREGLRNLQESYFNFLKDKKYDFERREEGSKKKHTDQSQWKSELIKNEKAFEKAMEEFQELKKEQKEFFTAKCDELDKYKEELNNFNKHLKKGEEDLKNNKDSFQKITQEFMKDKNQATQFFIKYNKEIIKLPKERRQEVWNGMYDDMNNRITAINDEIRENKNKNKVVKIKTNSLG